MNPAKKIASLLMLLVLLTTSTGFSVYTVLCQMTGESYSSIVEDNCCCQDKSLADKCCDQEAEFAQLDVETSLSDLRINIDTHFFVALVQHQINGLSPAEHLNTSKYLNYIPPLIERDISILVQSFLI